ncbi:hypothetical protein WN944_016062 [Citrus x changshan-huyou]|uniref:J domain-containing protein n=1 Tax=Citrus x changshan-huyou TaxID=2935761 RepID=A0AAP0MB99_9ROSI
MPVTAPGMGGSLYEVLRVEPMATILEIKTTYRSLAKVYHPDLSGNGRDFIEIHNGYETLSYPTARAVYDMSLASRRRTRTASFGHSGQSKFLDRTEDFKDFVRHAAVYDDLSVTVLAAFCRVPEIASSEDMVSKVPPILELLLKELLQLMLSKLSLEIITNDYLSELSTMVTVVAREFAVLHNALKFESLHLLTAVLSSNYSFVKSVSMPVSLHVNI